MYNVIIGIVGWIIMCLIAYSRNKQKLNGENEFYQIRMRGILKKITAPILCEGKTTVFSLILWILLEVSIVLYLVIYIFRADNEVLLNFPMITLFFSIVLSAEMECLVCTIKEQYWSRKILYGGVFIFVIFALVFYFRR